MVDDSNEVYTFTKKDMEKMWNKRMKDEINNEIEGKQLFDDKNSSPRGIKKTHLGDKSSGSAKPKKKTGLIPI
jgi:hypothetical protein